GWDGSGGHAPECDSEGMTEPVGTRRRDAQRSRDRLLDAAGELLERTGPRFTLPDLARHAGLGTATVYRHFADLSDVFAAFESRAMRGTLDLVLAVPGPSATDRFRQTCQVWVEHSMGEGAPARFLRSPHGMLERYRASDPDVAALVNALGGVLDDLITDGLV